jgi:aminotransferase
MLKASHRTSRFTESVIRRMTRVANACGAVNLAQGFPDFSPPSELLAALENVSRSGPHQYAVTWGAPNFRAALAKKQSRLMGLPLDPDQHVVVTCGSTEAMMASMLAILNPGDRVIIFSPFYENYAADAILAGAEPVFVPLRAPDFSFDPEELARAFAQGAKAIVLCNPGNPTGKVFTRDELTFIAHLAYEHDAIILTDEVYEHIVYEPHRHTYFASLPGMFERTLSCGSLSKTYSITGWRLGYVVGPENLVRAVRNVHDFLTVGAAAPLQEAAVTALEFPDAYYEKLRAEYSARRNLFLGYLDRANLRYFPPQGAYYVLVDVGFIGAGSDVAFSEWMAREVGVAPVPGSSFFAEPVHNLIRLHFAKSDATLHLAGQRLLALRPKAERAFFHYSI